MDRVLQIIEMLKSSPGDDFLQHALALEFVKKGEDRTARSIFEEVLGRNPGYVASYYHLAGLLSRNGETESACDGMKGEWRLQKAAGETRAYNELRGLVRGIEG